MIHTDLKKRIENSLSWKRLKIPLIYYIEGFENPLKIQRRDSSIIGAWRI